MLENQFQPEQYEALLEKKKQRMLASYDSLGIKSELKVFESIKEGFRCRAEFRFWHSENDSFYAMFEKGRNDTPIRIDHFPIAHPHIQQLMPLVRNFVLEEELLRLKLFQIEFLTTQSNQNLITLIYHKPLDEQWQALAETLQTKLQAALNKGQKEQKSDKPTVIKLIGRSKKQKLVLDDDYVDEQLNVNGKRLSYRQIEGSFTQPNAFINERMLSWACQQVTDHHSSLDSHDLLELYCGNGNFTAALAPFFKSVLATEISKSSVRAAHHNFEENGIHNVKVCRLSSEEMTQALNKIRPFRRLKQQDIELDNYQFSHIFVDPPRAGLDEGTLELCQRFDHILYVSCNPETLAKNLEQLLQTHDIVSTALFDQFPYTDHIESGVYLKKKLTQ